MKLLLPVGGRSLRHLSIIVLAFDAVLAVTLWPGAASAPALPATATVTGTGAACATSAET